MKFHDVADIFPKMTVPEFNELRASIKANGVREPVLVADGMIADGRHRWKAAEAEGVPCPTVEYNPKKHGASLVQYVMDKNLHRRQMTAGQRAMIATNALPLIEKETKERESERKTKVTTANLQESKSATSAAKAAKTTGVSERAVFAAKKLKTEAPELAAEVAAGTKSLNAAVKQSKAPPKPEPKPEALTDGTGREVTNDKLKEAMEHTQRLKELGRMVDEVRRGVEELAPQLSPFLEVQRITIDLRSVKHMVTWAIPHTECPYMPNCKRSCNVCKGRQWVPVKVWENIPKDIREAKTK